MLLLYDDSQLAPGSRITTRAGGQFRVYSSFWKALAQVMPPRSIPHHARYGARQLAEVRRAGTWELLPTKPDWSSGFATWTPGGEDAARKAVARFATIADAYGYDRNMPSVEGHVAFSRRICVSAGQPRHVWRRWRGHGESASDVPQGDRVERFPQDAWCWRCHYASANGRPAFDALHRGAAARRRRRT
jgi:deoxyribodipyrimidine photo-lyase